MDLSILARIIGLDAHRKGAMMANKNLPSEVILTSFQLTSQNNEAQHVLPANNNANEPKMRVAKSYSENKVGIISTQSADLSNLHVIPTPQVIKTHVFSNAAAKVFGLTPLQEFTLFGQLKSAPQKKPVEAVVYKMETTPAYSGNVVPFPGAWTLTG